MNFRTLTLIAATVAAVPTLALAHGDDFDIGPVVQNGVIVTNGYSDSTGDIAPNMRVFGYDFDPSLGYFTQDPGFNALEGSGLPGGSEFSFTTLSNLSYWDGTGAVQFGAPTNGDYINLSLSPVTSTDITGTGHDAGFILDIVGAQGNVHKHLNQTLIPGSGTTPAEGIYLYTLGLHDSDASIGDSLPFYIVMNNGMSEEIHDEAMSYVSNHLVPEPGMASVLLIGSSLLGLRRRRRN